MYVKLGDKWVNSRRILAIQEYGPNAASLHLNDGTYIYVKGSRDEIAKRLNKAEKKG